MYSGVEGQKLVKSKVSFVFFGTSQFAVTVLSELLTKGAKPQLIITQPDAPVGRKRVLTPPPVKVWAEINEVPLIQPVSLRKLSPDSPLFAPYDLGVVADYGKIIPQRLLDVPKRGMLNIHVSLLPQYRGASPMQTAILDGVKKTGVTIMQVVEKLDEGDIVAQEEFDLSEWHPARHRHTRLPLPCRRHVGQAQALTGGPTFTKLAQHTAVAGAALLAKILPDYITGNIKPTPQNHTEATYTKLFTDADGYINPEAIIGGVSNEEVLASERRVRALNPSPGTWTILKIRDKDMRVKIKSAHIKEGKLVPILVVPEGKKEMPWADFKRGNL